MILAIDTTSETKEIALYWPQKMAQSLSWQENNISLLAQINQLLTDNHQSVENLKAIVVNCGPGSFTGIRVGVSCANVFAYARKIPLVEATNQKLPIINLAKYGYQQLKANQTVDQVKPFYGQEPHISQPKH